MRYLRNALRVGIIVFLCLVPLTVSADTTNVPSLLIREIKITGEELVVLQATADVNLSEYWLGYVSSDTASAGSIVPTYQLPARNLSAGQAVLLASYGGSTCDAVLSLKLPVELADSKGTLVLRHYVSEGLTSTFTTVDSVNWAKPTSASATTMAQLDLRKESTLPVRENKTSVYAVWYQDPAFTQPWHLGDLEGCTLRLGGETPVGTAETIIWEQANEPPAIIENINEVNDASGSSGIPGENLELAPPLITELLPNPAGTGTDSTDEYVELYNSNDAPFYLSGFTLQTGLSTKHSYIFPSGVSVPAKSFRAFYASETGLSMSNTSGQATLVDGSGAMVAQSDPYDSAPDGQAWALANGTWYWTTKPTSAATNVIAQPIKLPATALKKVTTKTASTTKVKSASTKAPKTTTAKTKDATPPSARQTAALPKSSSVHPGVLALVAACAVGYGTYVYRKDLANALHKLRRH